MPSHLTVGEALSHVQGESLKDSAAVCWRLLNSPTTRTSGGRFSREFSMDRPYSAWADWLNKFHTSSEEIQALWLVAGSLTMLGVASLLAQLLKEMLLSVRKHRRRGRLLYSLYEDNDGRLLIYCDGEARRVDRNASHLPLPPSSPDLFRRSMP
jgi:hypothetical protein